MNIERREDLQDQCRRTKENIQKFEEIREFEAKIDSWAETQETSDLKEDRKSSQEERKQLLQETQMYTPTTSYNQKETQSRHSGEGRTFFTSEKRSAEQESINTINFHARRSSNFSCKIYDPLSIIWNSDSRCSVLRYPYLFKIEKDWHKIKLSEKHPNPGHVTLQLPGIQVLEQNGILFFFQRTKQWAGMLQALRVKTFNRLTLKFTTNAILEKIILPKGTILSCLYATVQLED